MVTTLSKVLIFLGGGVVAAGATAYVSGVLDPLIYGEPAALASLPAPATADPTPDPAAPKEERLPGAETPPAAADPAKPAESAAVVPSFDVVRVEPDGAMVIAGKAAGDVLVEALASETPIGKTQSDPAGDFAIVLDEPLKPGDYAIKLRTTDKAGLVTLSVETAVVSVPASAGGQVLAMIETPGQASEIITAPEPQKPAEAAAADPGKPAEIAADPVKPAEEKPAEIAAAPAPEKPAELVADPAPDKPADVAAAAPEKPADVAVAPVPAPEPATPEKPADVAAAPASPEGDKPAEVAVVDPSKPPAGDQAPSAPAAQVIVEAVEIEGSKIFVAGAANPKRTVRVYANETHLGDAVASMEGRFLVEADKELPVGSYLIRADLLGDDNVSVLARAAVPFEREPGEAIAAVAPGLQEAAAPPADKPADTVAADQPAEAKPGEGAESVADQPAEEKPADVAAAPAQPANPTPADPKPADAGSNAAGATEPASEQAAAEAPAATEPVQPVPEKPAEIAAAEPARPADAAGDQPAATAPKLEAVNSAVIIRRGDSLWRISRRVYGRGVRYSTLYVANQDQIQDPNRIWPGQVFAIPAKTAEGEQADMDAISDQLTTKTQ